MQYDPKVLKNPTKKRIEFMCDGQIYSVEPGEMKPFEGFTAFHALNHVKTGLVEVGLNQPEVVKESLDIENMKWLELRRYAKQLGVVYDLKMTRRQLVQLLQEHAKRS